MSHPSPQELPALRAAVERECATIEEVITILLREQGELVSGSSDGLDEVVSAKNASLDDLQRMRQRRLDTMNAVGAPTDPGEIDNFINADPMLARVWQRLRALARECQRLNTLNGRLVSVRLQLVNSRIDTLRRLGGGEPLYDSVGRSSYGRANRVVTAA